MTKPIKIISFCLIISLASCGGEETSSEATETNNDSTVVAQEEEMISVIEEENKLDWMINQAEFEGKAPEAQVALSVRIDGATDTLYFFTTMGYWEPLKEDFYEAIGFPENHLSGVGPYDGGESFVLCSKDDDTYEVYTVFVQNDSVDYSELYCTIKNENGSINSDHEVPESDMYIGYEDSFPW